MGFLMFLFSNVVYLYIIIYEVLQYYHGVKRILSWIFFILYNYPLRPIIISFLFPRPIYYYYFYLTQPNRIFWMSTDFFYPLFLIFCINWNPPLPPFTTCPYRRYHVGYLRYPTWCDHPPNSLYWPRPLLWQWF